MRMINAWMGPLAAMSFGKRAFVSARFVAGRMEKSDSALNWVR